MRISDWSSDVCSSDLAGAAPRDRDGRRPAAAVAAALHRRARGAANTFSGAGEIGRAHVCTPVTNAQLVCRLLHGKKTEISRTIDSLQAYNTILIAYIHTRRKHIQTLVYPIPTHA